MVGGDRAGLRGAREDCTGRKGASGGDGLARYLDCGAGLTGIQTCTSGSKLNKPYTLEMLSLLYANYTLKKLLKF